MLNQTPAVTPGTRLLARPFGYTGRRLNDPHYNGRVWTVVQEFCPHPERSDARLRVVDQLGFVSFINQPDFELLVGGAKPGDLNPWTMDEYPDIGDYRRGWLGLHTTPEDLEDDLHMRELQLRQHYGWNNLLPSMMQLTRFLHTGARTDERFLDMLLYDADPITGLGPDNSIAALPRRWSQIEREVVPWQ